MSLLAALCFLLPIGWGSGTGFEPEGPGSIAAAPDVAAATMVKAVQGQGQGSAADGTSRAAVVQTTAGGLSGLSGDPRRIAFGLFLDTPVAPETIERSLGILAGLRCRYGLHGGVRDDEEAAGRALEEIEALEFSVQDVARMAGQLGVSLDPSVCGEACENFERMVLLRLRMGSLERLAATASCPGP